MIPVMLAGTLFGTRKYSIRKYISVLIMTVGIILFQLLSNKKKVSTSSNSNLGLLLLVLSLCMDGVCGMQQDVVVPRFKPSSFRLQVMLNVYGMMIALVASLFSQELLPGLRFLLENRVCLLYCLVYGVCSSVGQMFILFTVRHFAPLVLSTITTTRKFFSILLSVVFMGNEITWGQVDWSWCFLSSLVGRRLPRVLRNRLRQAGARQGKAGLRCLFHQTQQIE
ncbi:UAA transporter [Blastocystis hominis]|uniref:UAA transporter n=1 Tax=Blastocystis hominis TaxID=12968 RepID=D8LWD0_BLAHO|nr:UAA transporter [Blastocystis hominis]CBK20119.2 UAA transporter [Blastocystis hominis]|eukprot:XP_012894167.1 UAA transporter [Blastocystis hominis]